MLYRKLGKTGEMVSILGYGCMRLPVIDGNPESIDEKKAIRLVRYAIDHGVNYIDSAYSYHSGMNEVFLGKALKDGYREKVHLATKLSCKRVNCKEDMDRFLNEQLEKLRTDCIDFYLLHAVKQSYWEKMKKFGVIDFLERARAAGKIKYTGFSFHDEPDVFKEVVDAYPWDLCQIQFNYLDENFQAGIEGLKYAAEKGLAVVIMEPLRGGNLASKVPEEAKKVWDIAEVKRTPAEWAFRYLWDYPEISVVLSGMSEMEHLKENLRIAEQGQPNSLSAEEKSLISEVSEIYRSRIKVNCTNCKYCMPCPSGVNIPRNLSYLNDVFMLDDMENAKFQYGVLLLPEEKAGNCIECGECEEVCPQNIKIRKMLKEVREKFE
ncbi:MULTISPECIES: aldo/keto reductase [Methanosarcina]|jgi:predicted aldo/keto reductase-like oxidoreductase|uniref:Aldo/keto reductase n=5 Tax=Methanosarcina mazei TaxID=2209 RepID=A0A0F8KTC8_METMZ|nr:MULTISPECIES: aldo/keto reductase [Methanosarcina]AAM32852.1 oxidoreductase [Methanosarcina mazei Go1]AKB40470.1 Aldo/keto reductase [Methanosarcina mazei WWM610]AKB64723.1 Aldo/keto reductase [Methanosarcina mazei S-6]AKB68270.1 Aldo/keto reductase [Methanosarcina mazei LYC]KKF99210.1 aldo/keto reductase [Methanosarcina mazei]